jgi:Ca2+-binding EF-hand superfamily protein
MHMNPACRSAPRWAGRLLLAAALVLFAAAAAAQVTATDQYLARMDGNQDGRVDLAEYQAWMGYAFERMDRNGDGQLTADELPGGRGQPVSLAAHRETLAAAFKRQDRDRDGFLSQRELAAPPQ